MMRQVLGAGAGVGRAPGGVSLQRHVARTGDQTRRTGHADIDIAAVEQGRADVHRTAAAYPR